MVKQHEDNREFEVSLNFIQPVRLENNLLYYIEFYHMINYETCDSRSFNLTLSLTSDDQSSLVLFDSSLESQAADIVKWTRYTDCFRSMAGEYKLRLKITNRCDGKKIFMGVDNLLVRRFDTFNSEQCRSFVPEERQELKDLDKLEKNEHTTNSDESGTHVETSSWWTWWDTSIITPTTSTTTATSTRTTTTRTTRRMTTPLPLVKRLVTAQVPIIAICASTLLFTIAFLSIMFDSYYKPKFYEKKFNTNELGTENDYFDF